MKAETKIENISCRIDFRQNFDIDPKKAVEAGFHAAKNISSYIYRHEEPKVEMMVFPSGEAYLTGPKSHEEVESSFWVLKKKLSELGLNAKIKEDTAIEVENVLASADLRDYLPELEIDLKDLAMKDNAAYNPEEMPAVFMTFFLSRMDKLIKATAMVFASGKVLIGDVRSHEDANLVLERLIDEVR